MTIRGPAGPVGGPVTPGRLDPQGPPGEDSRRQWDDDQAKLDHQERSLQIAQRRTFSNRFFWMAVLWLGFVAVAISLDAAVHVYWFDLDTEVAIALLATGTANVFAPVVVAARGIFNSRSGR